MSVLAASRERNTFSVGLMIALSSWALIFITLVWGYVVFRLRASSWLGGHLIPASVFVADINTISMAVSSWCLSVALKKYTTRPHTWAWVAFVLGLVFLVGQWQLWRMVMAGGLYWKDSIAGSFFFLLTGFHAAHIVGALIAVFILCRRLEQWQGSSIALGIKYFWDFLLIVWLILFALIFIIQ